MKLKITVSIEDIKFNENKKTDYAAHDQFFYFVWVHKLDSHGQNSKVLNMIPRSSKIKGYKGVITYVQK